MARLFDAYVMVDWSAAAKPSAGANSIWIGILAPDARLKPVFRAVNPKTRLEAAAFLRDMVGKLTSRGDKVLLGFDFALGYPAGTAAALGLDLSEMPPWRAMHAYLAGRMKDKPDNANPRFAVAAGMNYTISKSAFPFWGAPARDQAKTLAAKKGDFAAGPLPEFRETERFQKARPGGNPKSVWQLYGAGSVGGQSLTGIPHVHALRETLPDARIWPFETGLAALTPDALSGVRTLICEIYPSMIEAKAQPGEVMDQAQVRAIAHHYRQLDQAGQLAACFGPPHSLDKGIIPQIEAEEGWILVK